MRINIGACQLELVIGDVTDQKVDAIVNAANSRLAGGGGVDGAIHRHGGREIMAETDRKHPDGCPTGSAVISGAGNLAANHIIHAVGPVWRGGEHGEAGLLASAYRKSLQLSVDNDCEQVAFPALSAGAYGYPLDQAGRIALETATSFLRENGRPLVVRFVLFNQDTFDAFAGAAAEIAGNDEMEVRITQSNLAVATLQALKAASLHITRLPMNLAAPAANGAVRLGCFKVEIDRAKITLAFAVNSLRQIRLTPHVSPIAAEGGDAVGCRTDWPSRERINHPQKTNQRLGNPSVTSHLASKGAHLRSRRTPAAWLAVEGAFSPIARNGRITRPCFAIWSWQRFLRTGQSVLQTYAIRLTRLKQIRRERKTPQSQL